MKSFKIVLCTFENDHNLITTQPTLMELCSNLPWIVYLKKATFMTKEFEFWPFDPWDPEVRLFIFEISFALVSSESTHKLYLFFNRSKIALAFRIYIVYRGADELFPFFYKILWKYWYCEIIALREFLYAHLLCKIMSTVDVYWTASSFESCSLWISHQPL